MTLFGNLDLAAQRAHEAVFGEAFTFRPKALTSDVNAPRQTTPQRPVVALTAIYSERDVSDEVKHSWDRHTVTRPGVSGHVHMIEVDPRLWAVDLQKGDFLDRASPAQRWRIVSTDPQSDGRIVCNVERV